MLDAPAAPRSQAIRIVPLATDLGGANSAAPQLSGASCGSSGLRLQAADPTTCQSAQDEAAAYSPSRSPSHSSSRSMSPAGGRGVASGAPSPFNPHGPSPAAEVSFASTLSEGVSVPPSPLPAVSVELEDEGEAGQAGQGQGQGLAGQQLQQAADGSADFELESPPRASTQHLYSLGRGAVEFGGQAPPAAVAVPPPADHCIVAEPAAAAAAAAVPVTASSPVASTTSPSSAANNETLQRASVVPARSQAAAGADDMATGDSLAGPRRTLLATYVEPADEAARGPLPQQEEVPSLSLGPDAASTAHTSASGAATGLEVSHPEHPSKRQPQRHQPSEVAAGARRGNRLQLRLAPPSPLAVAEFSRQQQPHLPDQNGGVSGPQEQQLHLHQHQQQHQDARGPPPGRQHVGRLSTDRLQFLASGGGSAGTGMEGLPDLSVSVAAQRRRFEQARAEARGSDTGSARTAGSGSGLRGSLTGRWPPSATASGAAAHGMQPDPLAPPPPSGPNSVRAPAAAAAAAVGAAVVQLAVEIQATHAQPQSNLGDKAVASAASEAAPASSPPPPAAAAANCWAVLCSFTPARMPAASNHAAASELLASPQLPATDTPSASSASSATAATAATASATRSSGRVAGSGGRAVSGIPRAPHLHLHQQDPGSHSLAAAAVRPGTSASAAATQPGGGAEGKASAASSGSGSGRSQPASSSGNDSQHAAPSPSLLEPLFEAASSPWAAAPAQKSIGSGASSSIGGGGSHAAGARLGSSAEVAAYGLEDLLRQEAEAGGLAGLGEGGSDSAEDGGDLLAWSTRRVMTASGGDQHTPTSRLEPQRGGSGLGSAGAVATLTSFAASGLQSQSPGGASTRAVSLSTPKAAAASSAAVSLGAGGVEGLYSAAMRTPGPAPWSQAPGAAPAAPPSSAAGSSASSGGISHHRSAAAFQTAGNTAMPDPWGSAGAAGTSAASGGGGGGGGASSFTSTPSVDSPAGLPRPGGATRPLPSALSPLRPLEEAAVQAAVAQSRAQAAAPAAAAAGGDPGSGSGLGSSWLPAFDIDSFLGSGAAAGAGPDPTAPSGSARGPGSRRSSHSHVALPPSPPGPAAATASAGTGATATAGAAPGGRWQRSGLVVAIPDTAMAPGAVSGLGAGGGAGYGGGSAAGSPGSGAYGHLPPGSPLMSPSVLQRERLLQQAGAGAGAAAGPGLSEHERTRQALWDNPFMRSE